MSSENAVVKWDELLIDYNAMKGTNFATPKEMLEDAYSKAQTYKKTGKIFLLSCETIKKYMKKWGLKCLPKGHRGDSPCLRAIKALGDVSAFTVKQVAKQTGFSGVRVNALMEKHGIKYKKLRK